jgi:hypothetical protein
MIKQKYQPFVVFLLFVLAMSPLVFGALVFDYPAGPFGGGGGDAWPMNTVANMGARYVPVCGPICGGFVAWAIGKALDYMIDHWNDPAGCATGTCIGNASMGGAGSAGSLGGGGGNAF